MSLPLVGAGQSAAGLSSLLNAALAGKDTWINNTVGCAIDIARDGSDLQVEGVTATRKDVWMAWDLSNIPAGRPVTSATLTVNVKTAPAVANSGGDLNHIPNGDETWNEATLRCSTGGPVTLTNFQVLASNALDATGEKVFALNAAATARIATRVGVGFYTIVLNRENTLGGNLVLQSADEGTDNALGPRLTLT